jgi:hypothetical protein
MKRGDGKRTISAEDKRDAGERSSSAEVERDARTGKQERVQDRHAAAQPPAKDKLLKIEYLNALQALTFCPA